MSWTLQRWGSKQQGVRVTNEALFHLKQALSKPGGASSDFDLNPQYAPPAGRKLRNAAVLVALIDRPEGIGVVLTKRSSRLKHHPGQIAFPGGKQDETDQSLVDTALREAHEEIGLNPDSVEVLGKLPTHETVTSFTVTPILGVIHGQFDPVPEQNEVDEVFYAPYAHVTDPDKFVVQSRRWMGQRRHYYTVPFGPYYIWGATARILRGLADRISQ